MPRGGKRPGAGRKPGSKTKKTQKAAKEAAKQGITPLEYMLRILRDEGADASERAWAAEKAAPYIHPRLASSATARIFGSDETIPELPPRLYDRGRFQERAVTDRKAASRHANHLLTFRRNREKRR